MKKKPNPAVMVDVKASSGLWLQGSMMVMGCGNIVVGAVVMGDCVMTAVGDRVISAVGDSVVNGENVVAAVGDSVVNGENVVAAVGDSVVNGENVIASVGDGVMTTVGEAVRGVGANGDSVSFIVCEVYNHLARRELIPGCDPPLTPADF
jgi:hypothetical protein